MYQIGFFSKMNKVTVKTLHHYDEIGLLKPDFIDANTGYRYYTLGQSYILHRIAALKKIGFRLDDIKEIINGESKTAYLLQRKSKLLLELAEKMQQLAEVEFYLTQSEEDMMNQYEVVIKEIPEIIVASRRVIIHSYHELMDLMPQMGQAMREAGCVCALPEYCFTIYHNKEYVENNIDIEICESITELKSNSNDLIFKTLPKLNTVATAFHKGNYDNFSIAYRALITWIEENGYQVDGLARESYIDGIWNKENESEWLSEIQIPIRKI